MAQSVKQAVLAITTGKAGVAFFRPWTRDRVPILMLHRFAAMPQPGATDAAQLRSSLRFLAEAGVRVIGLAELCRRLAAGKSCSRMVCLTVDDGYDDFRTIAAPVLAEHGATATVFITSRFIDGDLWFWWDRIEYAFAHTRRERARMPSPVDALPELHWSDEGGRDAAMTQFTLACKVLPDEEKWSAIAALEAELDVSLPARPPGQYRGMTWDDIRRLQAQGIEFGGHTVTHPILSRVPPEQAEWEVVEGLRAIERNTGVRPETFAYPNGREIDFTDHVVAVLKREGVAGAVTGEWGIVSKRKLASLREPIYRLPRMGMPASHAGFVQAVCGLEALKQDLGYV